MYKMCKKFNPDSIHVQGLDESINWNVGFDSVYINKFLKSNS